MVCGPKEIEDVLIKYWGFGKVILGSDFKNCNFQRPKMEAKQATVASSRDSDDIKLVQNLQ